MINVGGSFLSSTHKHRRNKSHIIFLRMATPSDRDEPDALPVFDYVKKKVKQVLKIQDIEEDDDATQENQVQLVKVKRRNK